eukprot:tig00021312_g20063.t1
MPPQLRTRFLGGPVHAHAPHGTSKLRAAPRRRRAARSGSACRALTPVVASSAAAGRPKEAIVVGAGIAGLACAVALKRVGVRARVYEMGERVSTNGTAIGMWTNAFRALDQLRVGDRLRPRYTRSNSIEIYSQSGRRLIGFDFDSLYGAPHEFRYVLRGDLVEALMEEWGPGEGDIVFGRRCVGYSVRGGRAVARFDDGTEAEADLLLAADGARSAVRRQLVSSTAGPLDSALNALWTATGPGGTAPDDPALRYAGYTVRLGIADFGTEGLPFEGVKQVWGRGRKAGLAPLSDNKVFWFVTANAPQGSAGAVDLGRDYASFPCSLPEAIRRTDPASVVSVDVYDRAPALRWRDGPVGLVGDCAHPITPELGQGGALGLEDAVVLAQCVAGATSGEEALAEYEARRRPRAAVVGAKSRAIGQLIQIGNPLVVAVRDGLFPPLFRPYKFLSHAAFDPGALPADPSASG